MPTERFYRLPKEKRIIIRDAAIQEFIRVPFEKVSINKIIQNADISRGSFYTYFEDKRDVLAFIFHNMKESNHEFCKHTLESNHGDFWDMIIRLFDYNMGLFTDNHIFQLSKNLMLNPEICNWLEAECRPGRLAGEDETGDWLYQRINWSGFRLESKRNLELIIGMSMAALFISIAHFHQKGDPMEKVRKDFEARIEIIRYGVMQQ